MSRRLTCIPALFLLAVTARADDAAPGSAPLLRDKPPVIILKLDDLKPARDGGVPAPWKKFLDELDARKLKYGVGMIAEPCKDAKPAYVEWVKRMRDSGNVEIWFHGWDHAVHEENGTKYNEFNGRPFDDQKKRFDDAQKLMLEKFGFAFESFGPGGGVGTAAYTQDTLKVLHQDPHMKCIMYPSPINEIGKQLDAQGKVMVLDRVWAVGLEAKTFVPDSKAFIEGYKKNPTRDYFVLQGHPTHWDEQRHGEVVKILDFLQSQKCRFMTPIGYVNEVRAAKASK